MGRDEVKSAALIFRQCQHIVGCSSSPSVILITPWRHLFLWIESTCVLIKGHSEGLSMYLPCFHFSVSFCLGFAWTLPVLIMSHCLSANSSSLPVRKLWLVWA